MAQLSDDTITASRREAGNKGVARKLRRQGRVPAVAYGPGCGEPQYLALDPKSFLLQRRNHGMSHIYDVKVEDGGAHSQFKALIKAIQHDAVRRELLHVDLYAVDLQQEIRIVVPLELTGKPAGLIEGGLLSQVLRATEVQCLPNAVPAKLVADVSPLKVGDSLHLSDLVLPPGVKLTAHGDEAVALVIEPDEAPAAATPEAAAATPAAAPAAKPTDKK